MKKIILSMLVSVSLGSCTGSSTSVPLLPMSLYSYNNTVSVSNKSTIDVTVNAVSSDVKVNFSVDNQHIVLSSNSCTIGPNPPNLSTLCSVIITGVTPGVTVVTASANGYQSESIAIVVAS